MNQSVWVRKGVQKAAFLLTKDVVLSVSILHAAQ